MSLIEVNEEIDASDHQLGSDSYLYGETIDNQEISIKLNTQTTIKSGESVKVGFNKKDTHWFNEKGVSLNF